MKPCDVVTDYYCADSRNVTDAGVEFIMFGGHCHAPGACCDTSLCSVLFAACLGIELYNEDTGELICHIKPVLGHNDNPMDESSYLYLPPCIWGSEEEGLAKPPIVHPNTTLYGIKRANSTYYHYGVMVCFMILTLIVVHYSLGDHASPGCLR